MLLHGQHDTITKTHNVESHTSS